nr:hypothetical protein [Tanacetum cinerariifolium]
TILLGLPEDIYATVDSCETAQEIWLRVQQMMKGFDIGIQEKKAKLFNEWKRFTSSEGESTESYYHCFLKLMNDLKRNKHFPEKIASNLKFLNNLQPEWSRHVTIVHQTKDLHTADYTQSYDFLKYNQKDVDELKAKRLAKIQDPLALMANSNNPYNAGNLNEYNAVQNVGNQVAQNLRVSNVFQGNGNQILNRNGNLVVVRAEGNAVGHNGNQIRCYNCRGVGIQLQAKEYDLMAAAADLDEIEEVNANCILMANLQQASTSVPHNDNNGISTVTSVEQGGETVEQHPTNFEETRALYDSLYHNLAIEVEKVNSINCKLKETNADLTTELARFKNKEKCFEISQEKYDKLERCYQQSVYQEQCLSKKINALHLSIEKKKLKSDFKAREGELLDIQIQLEKKIKELNNILVKMGQSIQTIHMLSPKPDSFYHNKQKMALGYPNPFYLKQAQKKQQSLYDGKVLLEKHDPPIVYDSKETLQLAQESREKMKQLNKEIKTSKLYKD